MSKKGKAAVGVTVAAALAVTVGAGAAVAADMGYAPTTLGNSAYTNQVDVRNDYTVQAMRYTSCISNQNADSVDNAEGLSVKLGDASGDVSPIVVTNSLGKDIKEFTFKTSDESSYPGNQLSATLADGQSAGWAFEYAYGERSYTNASGKTISMPKNYLLKATFADGTTAEFHNVNMNGVRTLNLCYSPDYSVCYVERTTITNHTPDPNLYYEANLASYEGGAKEFDYHVNSSGRMGDLMYTASRSDSATWSLSHQPSQDIPDMGIVPALHGESEGDGITDVYRDLYWNRDDLTWR